MKSQKNLILIIAMILCICITGNAETNNEQYENALGLLKDNMYIEAGTAFAALGNYEDAPKYVMYCKAVAAGESGDYSSAITNLTSLGEFLDSSLFAMYYEGLSLENKKDYEKALEVFSKITLYRDVANRISSYPEKIKERDYKEADAYESLGYLDIALAT